MEWIWIAAVVVILLIIIIRNIRVVQQSQAYVVERLGAFSAVWGVGLHFKVPFLERVAKRVSLKEQVLDYPPQPVITKDNVTMQIDTVVYFQITDPKLYAYGVEQPMVAMETLTATTLRNIIGDLELDQTLTSRDVINTKMRAILDEATDPWGIKVNRVELKNILPPADIQSSMEKQMKAERDRRQAILQAEGTKKSAILIAEGEKESAILRADADKQAAILKAEAEQQAAMLIDGPFTLVWLQTYMFDDPGEGALDFELGVTNIPYIDEDGKDVSYNTVAGAFYIPKSAAHPAEAYEFAKFICDECPEEAANYMPIYTGADMEAATKSFTEYTDTNGELHTDIYPLEVATGAVATPYESYVGKYG